MIDAKTKKIFLNKGEKLNLIIANKLKEKGLSSILISNTEITGKYIAQDIGIFGMAWYLYKKETEEQ